MQSNFVKTSGSIRYQAMVVVLILAAASSGCSTLASLGLPVDGSNNEIMDPARSISEAPGESLLVPKELSKQPLSMYIVEVGDTLLIEPVRFDATIRLPGDQIVKPDGHISLGEFGRFLAVNKTIEQIQIEVQAMIDAQLRQSLEIAYELERRQRAGDGVSGTAGDRDEYGNVVELPLAPVEDRESMVALQSRIAETIRQNQVSVRLVNWESKRIYVLGEVNSPGSFTYTGNQTVLDGIIEAGGLSTRADRHQIIVARPTPCSSCRVVMKICYDHIVQLGDASTNYQLRPGDRVFVPSLTFCEDLKNSLGLQNHDRCPRCANCAVGCQLPTGCE